MIAGCSQGPTIEDQNRSFKRYENSNLGGMLVKDYLLARTALVMNGDIKIGSNALMEQGRWKIDHGSALSTGVACAISPDGYFISAKHVIEAPETELVYFTNHGPKISGIRIIESLDSHDLVLFKSDLKTKYFFPISPVRSPAGLDVISGGFSVNSNSAGKLIVERKERTNGTQTENVQISILKSTLPLRKGDSGGPLIDDKGILRGINSLVPIFYNLQKDPVSYHFFPSYDWLNTRIQKDRIEQVQKKRTY